MSDNNGLVTLEDKLADLRLEIVHIGDITPHWTEKKANTGIVNRSITSITLPDGITLEVGARFIRSLGAFFHINKGFFRYFDPDEVFARLQLVHPRTRVRLIIDRDSALAMSNPGKPFVRLEDLCRLLRDQGGRLMNVVYNEGIVTSTHAMDDAEWSVGGEQTFDHLHAADRQLATNIALGMMDPDELAALSADERKRLAPRIIGGEEFKQTYTLEVPVDGYGLPSVYLSLIRQTCTNGMVGFAPAFRTSITIGKDDNDNPLLPLGRAMECFNNDEGFDALRHRLEAALRSEASMFEVRMLAKAIHDDLAEGQNDRSNDVFRALCKLAGDVTHMFNIATEEMVSRKTQSKLAMECTVFDLLNFATEVTTHCGDLLAEGATKTLVWVGQMLAGEYDHERSLEVVDDDSVDEKEIRRQVLRDREVAAYHLDGSLRNAKMVHAISGADIPDISDDDAEDDDAESDG